MIRLYLVDFDQVSRDMIEMDCHVADHAEIADVAAALPCVREW